MLNFTGDINLTDWDFNHGFGIGSRIANGFNPFENIVRNDSDLWIGNFEGVASKTSEKINFASKVFRVDPDVLQPLHHFDVYGLANNHAMQHGSEAYFNTVKSLESFGCLVFGLNDRKSIDINYNGTHVTLTGMCLRIDEFCNNPSYWYNPDYNFIEEEVTSLSEGAFKVLYIHWGNEYINRPSSSQKKLAHWLIDIGFDLVIGMHPHVLQGYEDYKGKRIYYSLGNFIFDMASDACKYGAVVGVEFISGKPVYYEKYVEIGNNCAPRIISRNSVPQKFSFEYLNEVLKKDDNSENYHIEIKQGYKKYRKVNRRKILAEIFFHPKAGIEILFDFINRRF